jgi:tartrate-resistant acid phosphatase type 5
MREFDDRYEEEYVYLADLTDTAALISWGKFFFASTMELVPDKKIHLLDGQHGRHTSIGANCESYGPVDVEVRDESDVVVGTVRVVDDTFTWVTGLTPDTEYTYRVLADPDGARRVWADGHLCDYNPKIKELVETSRRYACRFRTFPSLNASAPVTFAVIGDTGTGSEDQRALANALEVEIEKRDVRFVVMTGDTVYKSSGGTGNDDDEWLMTYFQPYRTLIDRIPFFPCVGNHDTGETFLEGGQGDTLTLYDNLLVSSRFGIARPGRDASITKGLFYRFRFGSDIELMCLDTSKDALLFGSRMFEKDPGKSWMRDALTTPLGSPKWRIPFSHHPPYCAGPQHGDTNSMREKIIPRCVENGVRVFISGHEHNFQCIDSEDADKRIRCIVTGGAGQFRTGQPEKSTNGNVHSWGGNAGTHFLIVTINGSSMTIEPITAARQPLTLSDRLGGAISGPIVVTL